MTRPFSSARLTRRQLLKASLLGMSGLAAIAGGVIPLDTWAATSPGVGRWRRLAPKTTPSPRAAAAMAYDGARRRTVLFSGDGAEADTWTWNGVTWTHQDPPLSPPARDGASLAYHPPTQTLVLFGGGSATGDLGDTWLWNGRTWRSVAGRGPRARVHASMSFDPITSGVVLFGGYGGSWLGDTWIWDGRSWHALSPESSPPATVGGSLALNADAGKLILFGGSHIKGTGSPDATWAWDGTSWSRVSFGSPPAARYYAAMAADPTGKLILLFGGRSSTLLGDTWTLTSVWVQDPQTPAPSPRYNASLAPDPSGTSFILFGGADAHAGQMDDTWAWEPA